MMSYAVYKSIHLLGLLMTFMSLGALLFHSMLNQGKAHSFRKPVVISHGVGLFLMLLGGFGMLARLGIHSPWPHWVTAKVVIWVILGGIIAVFYRKPQLSKFLWLAVLVLGFLAAYLATWKPI